MLVIPVYHIKLLFFSHTQVVFVIFVLTWGPTRELKWRDLGTLGAMTAYLTLTQTWSLTLTQIPVTRAKGPDRSVTQIHPKGLDLAAATLPVRQVQVQVQVQVKGPHLTMSQTVESPHKHRVQP